MPAEADAEALLTLWERGVGKSAHERDNALLLAAYAGGNDARTLGERNSLFLELHARLFGRELDLTSHCPACDSVAQFRGDADVLAAALRPGCSDAAVHRLDACGHRVDFRLPDTTDLVAAADGNGDFARSLIQRCIVACTVAGRPVGTASLPEPVLDALSRQMELLDPGASVSFALACPACANHWQARLDAGDLLWQKVRNAAERLLLEVDLLARTYGWTEGDVLRLKPLRRAAYLQLAGT